MIPIGGYFGLSLPLRANDDMFHDHVADVNFGRGGLSLILQSRGYRKIWIPDYICLSVPRYLDRIGIKYSTYEIDINLEPIEIPRIAANEVFLYVNYFGVKDKYCRQLEQKYSLTHNLILDLTQAYYYIPAYADAFNSARKFFGVPDGGFVYGKGLSNELLPESRSYNRCEALLRRADGDLSEGYAVFQNLENDMEKLEPARMSMLTRQILWCCDTKDVYSQRKMNFKYLASSLNNTNILKLEDLEDEKSAPLVYPYLVEHGDVLKSRLISKKVFCPTYWPGLQSLGDAGKRFATHLVCIPCDQRYGKEDMHHILELINE